MKFLSATYSDAVLQAERQLGLLLSLIMREEIIGIASMIGGAAPDCATMLRLSFSANDQYHFIGEGVLHPESVLARYMLAAGRSYYPALVLTLRRSDCVAQVGPWYRIDFYNRSATPQGGGYFALSPNLQRERMMLEVSNAS